MNCETSTQSHLLIQLADEHYAINVSKVYQILEVQPITKVPQTPPYMLGIINVCGRIIPVIDLRILYGIEKKENSKHTAIITISCKLKTDAAEQPHDIGILVDAVPEVVNIDYSQVEHPVLPGKSDNYSSFSGFVRLGNNIVMLLNVDNLLNSESIAQLKAFISQNSSL